MNSPRAILLAPYFRNGLRTAGIVMLIVGSLVAVMARSENDSFQFCTTKAYGWPAPWKIDHCECEGGQTIYPALSAIINVGLILASGLCGLIVSTWLSRRKRAVEESDFGRRFGWLIERDGEIVGELEYLRWDSYSQFWHEYRVVWRRPEDAVVSPDAWIAAKLVLRNRRYTDIVADAFLTSQDPDTGIVSVRGAYAPEKRIRRGNKL